MELEKNPKESLLGATELGSIELDKNGQPAPTYTKRKALGNKWHKQVLFNQRGSIKLGEMVGIMGPTGSGKTSLLNVLSMRTGLSKGSTFKGSIKVDGIELKNRNEF